MSAIDTLQRVEDCLRMEERNHQRWLDSESKILTLQMTVAALVQERNNALLLEQFKPAPIKKLNREKAPAGANSNCDIVPTSGTFKRFRNAEGEVVYVAVYYRNAGRDSGGHWQLVSCSPNNKGNHDNLRTFEDVCRIVQNIPNGLVCNWTGLNGNTPTTPDYDPNRGMLKCD